MKRTLLPALLIGLATYGCSSSAAPTAQPPAAPTATAQPGTSAAPTAISPTESARIELVDGLGRPVELSAPASRIVSIVPSNTEILFAIGAGGQTVGRDEFSDYPEAALEVTSIGSTYGELNVEAILALDPDLVLAGSITAEEQVQAMESVNLTVFVVTNPTDFEGLFANIENVGSLAGRQSEAVGLVDQLRQRYEVVLEPIAGAEPVSVFYEFDGSDPNAPWTTGAGTFQQMVFDVIAGQNIAADINQWGQLSLEEILVRDPQVIVFGSGPFIPTNVENLSARPGWTGLQAVTNGRVYALDTDLIDLPGPRLVDGLEQLAAILHPDLFGQ